MCAVLSGDQADPITPDKTNSEAGHQTNAGLAPPPTSVIV